MSRFDASVLFTGAFHARRVVSSLCTLALVAGFVTTMQAGAAPRHAVAETTHAATPVTPVSSRPDAVSAMLAARAQGSRVLVSDATTETSQTWANPDGTFTEEDAAAPVRVQAGDGTWQPVDTTLQVVGGHVAPKAVVGSPVFSAGGDTTLAAISGDTSPHGAAEKDADISTTTTLAWPTKLPKPTLSGNTATYPNVLPGADLEVSATPRGYGTYVILEQRPSSPLVLRLPMQLSHGMRLRLTDDGGIEVVDAAGAVILSMPPMRMWDATVDPATGEPLHVAPVEASVDSSGSNPVLVLAADPAFLADPATVYPVTIDPYAQAVAGVAQDSYVNSATANQTVNYGSSARLRAATGSSGGGPTQNTYLQFDVSDLPQDTKVSSATVSLYAVPSLSTPPTPAARARTQPRPTR